MYLLKLRAYAVLFVFLMVLLFPYANARTADVTAPPKLLILMYHGVLPDNSGHLGQYVISVSEFESDLTYLTENGYQTVGVADVIDYVQKGAYLPEKAVMLTFDDGYYNNYLYAYPLLQQYSCCAVLSPIAKWTDHYSETGVIDERYTHVTWKNLREMLDSGLVEVGNHTYDLHTTNEGRHGSAKKEGESVVAYQQLLETDLKRAQEQFRWRLDITPQVFAYPFGAVSKEALTVLQDMGFQAAFTCEEKVNILSRDEDCLFRLGRYRRPHGISGAQYLSGILF